MSADQARQVPWGLAQILLVLGITVVGWAVVVGLSYLLVPPAWRDAHTADFVLGLTGVLYVVLYLAMFLVVLRRPGGWQAVGYFAPGWSSMLAVLAWVPAWFVLEAFLGFGTSALLNHGRPIPSNTTDLFGPGGPKSLGPAGIALAFLVAAVIAPVVEETLFRGLLYQWLRGRLGLPLGVTVSAGAFAAVHGLPLLLPMLFALGCILAIAFQRTRSLYASMVLHAANNAVAVAVTLAAALH